MTILETLRAAHELAKAGDLDGAATRLGDVDPDALSEDHRRTYRYALKYALRSNAEEATQNIGALIAGIEHQGMPE